jgi:Family of unknown function (DUF6161)
MSDRDTFQSPLTLTAPGIPRREFGSVAEVRAWLQTERSAWNPLFGAMGNKFGNEQQEFIQTWNQLESGLNNYVQEQINQPGATNSYNGLQASLNQLASSTWKISTSPDGAILIAQSQTDKDAALVNLFVNYMGKPIQFQYLNAQINGVTVIRELIRTNLDQASKADYSEAYARTLDAAVTEFQMQVDLELQKVRDFKVEADNKISEEISKSAHQREDDSLKIDEIVRKQGVSRGGLARSLKAAKRDYLALNETYRTDLQLRAPATYWRDRAHSMRMSAGGSLACFIVFALIILGVAAREAPELKTFVTGPDGHVEIAALLLLSPLVVIPVWLFRMVSKIFTTSISEAFDASQRRVMITTFLALRADPKSNLSDAERFLILQALFRSSSAKDDDEQLPTSFVDLLAKAAQGSNK